MLTVHASGSFERVNLILLLRLGTGLAPQVAQSPAGVCRVPRGTRRRFPYTPDPLSRPALGSDLGRVQAAELETALKESPIPGCSTFVAASRKD